MEQLGFFLDANPQAVIVVNSEGIIVIANREATKMFGYEPGKLMNQLLKVLVPPDISETYSGDIEEFFAVPKALPEGIAAEMMGVRQDGTEFPIQVSLGHLSQQAGELAFAIITDISGRKGVEAAKRLAEKWEAIGQKTAGIAHDFNNMLSVISGYLDLLKDELGNDHLLISYVTEALEASNRMTDMARQLLSESRKDIETKQTIDLNQVVESVTNMLRTLAGIDRVQLRTELAAVNAAVRVNANQIQQLLMNLVANARDAMPEGGTLTIRTANRNGCLILEVTDTGQGMAEETLHHLFEPFFTTKEAGKGTGLGLAAVHSIVAQSGGTIDVDSEQDKGTTFTIRFP